MQFGDRLKELREEKELKQAELANLFNISPSTIGMYEQNRRTPDFALLNSIADYFGVSIDYLLGRTNIRNYEENTIAAHTDDRTQQLSEEGRKRLDDFIDYLIFEEMKKKND
ncbi:helix-turn-helix transcriptional regulator [Peptacetobacter hiranonis]|uniref:helix-turn-helix domain-containing protein n=1 Tax=Peptacetobacter hiranonis TaxID=89152 RepID=UPI002E77A755|nr:helix-turn-helix transcriptional regulator [Peptacetobacter hiranonis]MEE0247383.1 helix-turn-helix transcriptional regulator [Peptacetobacter hiranonis]